MKCENCGKEHDGSYGSGRFCSDHCRRVYSGKRVNVNGKHKCNFQNKLKAPYGTWKCKFCNKIFETKNLLQNHIWECHKQKSVFHGKGIPAWNKGLTNLPPLSKETKDKIVRSFKKSRGLRSGEYKGYYFDRSYELAWIIWNLEHNIEFKRCNKSFEYFDTKLQKKRRYYPDFELMDGTIVEIKGYVSQNALDKKYAMKQQNIKYQMLTYNQLKVCIDYCINKYGVNYLETIKNLN